MVSYLSPVLLGNGSRAYQSVVQERKNLLFRAPVFQHQIFGGKQLVVNGAPSKFPWAIELFGTKRHPIQYLNL